MRYAKGSLVINAERDVPLLRQVRNSKFVSHHQLFEFMKLGGFDHSRNSFNWRVRRLLDSGHIGVCQRVCGAGSTVYHVTKDGIMLLEYYGQFTASWPWHARTCSQAGRRNLRLRRLTPFRGLLTKRTTTRLWRCGSKRIRPDLLWSTNAR